MHVSGVSFAGSTTHYVNNYARNSERLAVSLKQLSTGKRINSPADDPAGFVAAEEIRGELVELRAEQKAATYRRVEVRRQQSALGNIQSSLHHVRGNVVAAADDLLGDRERHALQEEVDQSLDTVDRIASQVEGVEGSENLEHLRTGGLANLVSGDIQHAINTVDDTLERVSSQRAALGSSERIDQVFERLRQDKEVILTETLSQIEDTDFAAATAELAQSQVLISASVAALAYATQQLTDQMSELMETIDVTAG